MGDKIKLFHVSFNIEEPLNKLFVPRVPENAMSEENILSKRICFSDSITGCLNSIGKTLETDDRTDSIPIIVWETELELSDKNLVSWKKLHEENLVPDAAVTHEYWYLKPLSLNGAYYRIKNVKKTMNSKKEVTIIKHCYKKDLLEILSRYNIDETSVEDIDVCTLVNEWIPYNLGEYRFDIMKELNAKMTIVVESDINDSIFEKIFGRKQPQRTIVDSSPLSVFENIEVERVPKSLFGRAL